MMKDSSLIGFRIALLASFVLIIFLFLYFLYPSIKAVNDGLRMENLALQNEKLEIEKVILEEDVTLAELDSLRDKLKEIQYTRDIDEYDFEDNIRTILKKSALDSEIKEIEIGDLQKKTGGENTEINLNLVPIKINLIASADQTSKAVRALGAGKSGLYIINTVSSEDSYIDGDRNWTIEIDLIYYDES